VKRNLALVLLAIALITAGLFLGKRMSKESQASASTSSNSIFHPATQGPDKGTTAPDFDLKVLDGGGKTMKLSSLRGKAVIVDFWATYCGPCKIEMPWFVEMQKEFGPQGLQIVGVAMDDASTEDIAKFAKEMGVNYPILLGKESVGQSYGGVGVLPTTYFVNRDGKVTDREFGLQSRSVFVDNIKKALSQGQAVQARK
jgi:thiol-disulfide isomerase/thioredoxin